MRTVAEYVRNRFRLQIDQPYFGLEVEVENCTHIPNIDCSPWDAISDGSLRHSGLEFLSARPFTREVLHEAVTQLYGWESACRWTTGVRTSTHVHVNAMGHTLHQVAAVCALYALVEPLLFRFCGPLREENIYCVPWYRTPSEVEVVRDIMEYDSLDAVSNACKYSGLYLQPLVRFGTFEFRQAPVFDTPTDLLDWVEMCECIVYNDYDTPDQVIEEFTRLSPDHFVQRTFGTALASRLRDACERSFEDLFDEYDVEALAEVLACTYKPTASGVWARQNIPSAPGTADYHLFVSPGMFAMPDDILRQRMEEMDDYIDEYNEEEDY